jgi:hypothetical protein
MRSRRPLLQFVLSCAALVLAIVPAPARAAVPSLINYHGFLTDEVGQPLTGPHDLGFALYADSTGGAPFWQESHPGVTVAAGSFAVMLGSASSLGPQNFSGAAAWLETTVDGTPLAPRRPMVSVGYAFRAARADTAQALASGGPIVVHTSDPRAGCPPVTPASGVLFAQSLPLASSSMVMISGHIARLATGRVDLMLYVDGSAVQYTATNTSTNDWLTGVVTWSGTLAAGAHTVELRSGVGTTWGCGPLWGAIDTIVLK